MLLLCSGVLFGSMAQAQSTQARTTADILDSLLFQVQEEMRAQAPSISPEQNIYGFAPDERPEYPAETVYARLKALNYSVPMDYNPVVQSYIDTYTKKYPNAVSTLLGRAQTYFPIVEPIFDRAGIPDEMKYLAIVESALNPKARSWVGATGLWQFMHGTGRMMGLRIDSYVDERLDPFRATEAAAKYLNYLYNIYGDWYLSLAAYNAGPGWVNKAIERAGGVKDYWQVAPYLPRETRGYVPAFIGACYAMNYPAEHNIYPLPQTLDLLEDSIVVVRRKLALNDLARLTDTDYQLLLAMNPSLKRGIVPYAEKPVTVRVPRQVTLALRSLNRANGEGASLFPTELVANRQPANTQQVFHTLSRNESLQTVAQQYHVQVEDIVTWNKLWGYDVKPGMRLLIWAPTQGARATAQGAQATAQGAQATAQLGHMSPAKYYRVQSGDTLWQIAVDNGTTIEQLCELNDMKRTEALAAGQRIRVQ